MAGEDARSPRRTEAAWPHSPFLDAPRLWCGQKPLARGDQPLHISGSHQLTEGGDPVSHCLTPRVADCGTRIVASLEARAS